MHAYNCISNGATGFSPFYLLFSRSPRLLTNPILGLPRNEVHLFHADYAKRWAAATKEAYALAMKNISKSAADGKTQYDQKVRLSNSKPSDSGLVRKLSEKRQPGNLRSYWDQQVDIIMEQKGDLLLHEVSPEGEAGKSRVIHRNLLLPRASP